MAHFSIGGSAAIRKASDLSFSARSEWSPSSLAGRLVELSGSEDSAALTCAFGLVRQAQLTGEPVAWIGTGDESFYPPDVAAGGVDLESLAVVRVHDRDRNGRTGRDGKNIARAADQLTRSGAFGLLVLDIGCRRLPMHAFPRLLGLAQKHRTAIVFLTDKPERESSLGSLITLRGHARRKACRKACRKAHRHHHGKDEFVCTLTAVKDKRRAPGWKHEEICGGPDGLH